MYVAVIAQNLGIFLLMGVACWVISEFIYWNQEHD